MQDHIRIGTRESQLATWQANEVKRLLSQQGHHCELVFIKSEGDINLSTPLYEMGVQGIFTKALDIALLENRIDIAVHSMKDVPVALAKGTQQFAVLPRANYKDLLVFRDANARQLLEQNKTHLLIATSSIRRKAQWLHRYPDSSIENLRGNVNTRMKKLSESQWHGAIFAAAGLERIGLRPSNAIDLDWMLPAPAQGAIIIVGRENDNDLLQATAILNHQQTALAVKAEREFLRLLQGGCSTPISALASINGDKMFFKGNITSDDGVESFDVEENGTIENAMILVTNAVTRILALGAKKYISE